MSQAEIKRIKTKAKPQAKAAPVQAAPKAKQKKPKTKTKPTESIKDIPNLNTVPTVEGIHAQLIDLFGKHVSIDLTGELSIPLSMTQYKGADLMSLTVSGSPWVRVSDIPEYDDRTLWEVVKERTQLLFIKMMSK